MNTKRNKSDITLESIEVANNIKNEEDKNKCLTLLYVLFDKFGDEKSKKKFKEVVSMTSVGRMIYQEGLEEGIEEGIEGKIEGKTELLIKQLFRKFKKLPEEYKNKICSLSNESIEQIANDIFDLEKVEDLEQYF